MRRWALAPVSLAVALAIGSETPVVLIAQATPIPGIELSAPSDAIRDRMDAAVRLAFASYRDWLGPPPFDRLAIRDAGAADSPGQMQVESQAAQQLARAWLGRVAGNDAWKDGAAEYLQSRIVERLFDQTPFGVGHRYAAACFFGCHVAWSFRQLPLTRWTAIADPVAIAFASLERELGWPTLQGALRAAASGANPDAVAAMSEATGRDLAPVFRAALSPAPIDHAVTGLRSAAGTCERPCYRTQVSIASTGAVPFPLLLLVSFSDGQSIETRWDGSRDRLAFESAAPAVAASLDPGRVLLLDRKPLNNALVPPRQTNVPVVKWLARWVMWLQDALLTQTFPV
jgi:hypothetical protein